MFAPVLAAILPVHDVVAEIVPKVTALAPSPEVVKSIIVFVAIDVRGREYYHTACLRMRDTIYRAAFRIVRRAFAAVNPSMALHRAQPYKPHDESPLRVIFAVVDGHQDAFLSVETS